MQLAAARGCVNVVEWLVEQNARVCVDDAARPKLNQSWLQMPDDILFDTLQGFTFAQDKALEVVYI